MRTPISPNKQLWVVGRNWTAHNQSIASHTPSRSATSHVRISQATDGTHVWLVASGNKHSRCYVHQVRKITLALNERGD
jgi:hypothetical protein